jgi:outer membrane protein assembly factor BamA
MNDARGMMQEGGLSGSNDRQANTRAVFRISRNAPVHHSSLITHHFLWAVLLLLLSAPAHADGISLDISGQSAFNGYRLRNLLPEEPEKLRDDEVTDWAGDAAWQLERFYREQGYFLVTVTPTVERPDASKKEWAVALKIGEGKRYRFRNVRVIIGKDSSGAGIPAGELEAKADRPYLEAAVIRDVRQLTRAYGNAGFVRAEVKEDVVLLDSLALADVTYNVSPGEPSVFDTLHLNILRSGTTGSLEGLTREGVLRGLIPYSRGDTLRVDQTDRVIEKLQSTGLYHSVRIEEAVDSGGKGTGALTLSVEEKIPGRINASVYYETQYGFGVSSDVSHMNVAGTLNEVRLGAGLAQKKQSATVGYGSPLTFGFLLRFDDDMIVEWFQDKLPDAPTFGGDFRAANLASLSRSFSYWLRWVGGMELEYRSRVVSDSAGNRDRERGGILNYTNTGFASFLDQPLNPARGKRFALTWGNGGPVYEEHAFRIFSRRHNWLEGKSAAYYYMPPWYQFKVAARLDAGRVFGAGGQNADRFFLGGPRSVRSYGFHELCPDSPTPDQASCPLKGENLEPAYFLASGELRLSLFDFAYVSPRGFVRHFKPLEVVPFVDYGKVWNLRGEENMTVSQRFITSGYGRGIAYGGGVRYPLLGIFNLRLDLAWGRPDPGGFFGQSSDRLPDQWLIDLAQAF